ncbi:MAG: hypothetical protein LZF60_140042 [Nitrospira sp.]|nr:MAG: hypothetical protein LZF60_140042 [Nitrospira sp.]
MIHLPTTEEIAAFENKPKPEMIDSALSPNKERHELSRTETTGVSTIAYSDGTVRRDYAVSQSPVIQPTDGSLPIQ